MVKSTVEISQNFVTFSEYMNFNVLGTKECGARGHELFSILLILLLPKKIEVRISRFLLHIPFFLLHTSTSQNILREKAVIA